MKTTKNLGLNMPDANDFVEIDKINKNTEKIDEELAKKADASGGDISETVITTVEASQAEYPVPAAGDSVKTVLGKVQKFFTDIRNWMTGVCLLGQIVNNCVTDNAKLPLSAAQGKVLMDLYNVRALQIHMVWALPVPTAMLSYRTVIQILPELPAMELQQAVKP